MSTLTNNIWDIPFLPDMPKEIYGIASNATLLTTRNRGEWQFLYEKIDGVPSPFAKSQNYNFDMVKPAQWLDVAVPGSLTLQGFDIQNNTEYYYKRTITVEKRENERVFLRSEGIYSNARVWLNNIFVTAHLGGFTPFDIELTDFLTKEITTITIVIGVCDLEGKEKGLWNESGREVSDAGWASYYAHFNVGGILRDITLYSLPKDFILTTHIETDADLTAKSGSIKGTVVVATSDIGQEIEVEIVRDMVVVATQKARLTHAFSRTEFLKEFTLSHHLDGKIVTSDEAYNDCFVRQKKCDPKADLYQAEFSITVISAKLWCAESPNLYHVNIRLLSKESIVQQNTLDVGIRKLEYGGANNTDKNKMYINGREIKLRGVCRHDVSVLWGRSLPKEEELAEVLAYKRNNINFVRTSHYPASKHFLSLCDQYGIYAEVENAVCFKGANGYEMLCSASQILQNLSEMIEYYFNHTSVVIWSTANESGYTKSSAFQTSYQYVKEVDKTRPVIFSYPDTVPSDGKPYDIYSKHYAKIHRDLGRKDMPVLHDEFAHVCCYNVKDIKHDNNYRLAWGESIRMGWSKILNADGALGCAIWGGVDDVFYPPKPLSKIHQRHTDGRAIGYGEWGAVLDAFKREKPEAYLTKKAFTPIKLKSFFENKQTLSLQLENRFDHTDLSEVDIEVKNGSSVLYCEKISKSVLPKTTGVVDILLSLEGYNVVVINFFHRGILVESETINKKQTTDTKEFGQQHMQVKYPELKQTKTELTIKFSTGVVLYIRKTPFVFKLVKDGEEILGALKFTRNKVALGGEMSFVKVSQKSGLCKIQLAEKKGLFLCVRYTLTIANGQINISAKPNCFAKMLTKDSIGVSLLLKPSVSAVLWDKNCAYSSYPDTHIGRAKGIAVKSVKRNEYAVQNGCWKDDEVNYFLTGADEKVEETSFDFSTKRTDINAFSVRFSSGAILNVWCGKEKINAICEGNELRIDRGARYTSLLWGNYYGEHLKKEEKNELSFFIEL